MQRFKFPLQAVLTLRKMREEEALDAYAQAVQDCTEKRRAVMDAIRRADDLEQLLTQKAGTRFSPNMQQAYLAALSAARDEVVKLETLALGAESEKEQRLQEFLEARRNAEILEKLKEKQTHEHTFEQMRKEERELEDIVNARRPPVAST